MLDKESLKWFCVHHTCKVHSVQKKKKKAKDKDMMWG